MQVVEEPLARFSDQIRVEPQRVDVGPQARQGRPQLVAGVLDQPLLLDARAVQRVEHGPERASEAADLVAAAEGHRDLELAGRLDGLGGVGESEHRSGGATGDPPACCRGEQDHRDADTDGHVAERAQRLLGVGQAARDDDLADPGSEDAQDAVRGPVDRLGVGRGDVRRATVRVGAAARWRLTGWVRRPDPGGGGHDGRKGGRRDGRGAGSGDRQLHDSSPAGDRTGGVDALDGPLGESGEGTAEGKRGRRRRSASGRASPRSARCRQFAARSPAARRRGPHGAGDRWRRS